jgi:hypothetical protein
MDESGKRDIYAILELQCRASTGCVDVRREEDGAGCRGDGGGGLNSLQSCAWQSTRDVHEQSFAFWVYGVVVRRPLRWFMNSTFYGHARSFSANVTCILSRISCCTTSCLPCKSTGMVSATTAHTTTGSLHRASGLLEPANIISFHLLSDAAASQLIPHPQTHSPASRTMAVFVDVMCSLQCTNID